MSDDISADEMEQMVARSGFEMPNRQWPKVTEDCFNCGQRLTKGSGHIRNGWSVRLARCGNCRLQGVGDTARVQVTPEDITADIQRDLQNQRSSSDPQSVLTVAAFLDWDVPAGVYHIYQVEPYAFELVDFPDDAADAEQVMEHVRLEAEDRYHVAVHDELVRLAPRELGTPADAEAAPVLGV